MVNAVEKLSNGVLQIKKSFEDGSSVVFRATASSNVLKEMGLAQDKIYNLDTKTILTPEELETEKYEEVINDDDVLDIDKYLSKGVSKIWW